MAAVALIAGVAVAGDFAPPPWAYPVPAPGTPQPSVDDTVVHLPGSSAAFTNKQVRDGFNVADWHPGDHPKMPDYVAHGRKPDVRGCAYCHLPNGQGRPENASLAGQPADYIVEQVVAMREGRRHSSVPQMGPPAAMLALSKHVNDSELKIAAVYFAGLTYHPWVRVVETDMVPKSAPDGTGMMTPTADGAKEKIGTRIFEEPEDAARTEQRDPRSGFIAYVPKGSIARGKRLVDSGGGAQPCSSCHGGNFKGQSGTPALAGRSPTYLIRQMYDIQHGNRSGPLVDPMKPEVAKMTEANMVDVAAYLSSRRP